MLRRKLPKSQPKAISNLRALRYWQTSPSAADHQRYLANSILDRFQSEEEITTAFGENGFSVRKRSKFELWAFKKVQGKFPTSYVYDVFLLIDSSGQFQVREVRVTGHGP